MVKANAAPAEGTAAGGDPAAGDAAEHPGSAATMHSNAAPMTDSVVSIRRGRRIARASHGCLRADHPVCGVAPGPRPPSPDPPAPPGARRLAGHPDDPGTNPWPATLPAPFRAAHRQLTPPGQQRHNAPVAATQRLLVAATT